MSQQQAKERVGKALADKVKHGELIGVGTGSTVDAALRAIKSRVDSEGLQVSVVTSSYASAWSCEQIGLQVLYPGFQGKISWAFDGADEVDPDFRLIKGKGGALLQEKILAVRSQEFIIVVDESKLVKTLGAACAVPVEVIPTASGFVYEQLKKLGAEQVTLRSGTGKHGATITEAGNIIFDAKFSQITKTLPAQIKALVGVVEHGIFATEAKEVWVAQESGIKVMTR